jgi:AcrR family transcriptional regulator
LATAQTLFYRDGVRATGIDRIIDEAKVTKVTFYRHFPSKDVLVEAFLERRHRAWIDWFGTALAKAAAGMTPRQKQETPLLPVLVAARQLIGSSTFRGCAFANTVAELGGSLPSTLAIATRHKNEVCEAIAALLPGREDAVEIAWAATLALDGAIVNAQRGGPSAAIAQRGLEVMLRALPSAPRVRGRT